MQLTSLALTTIGRIAALRSDHGYDKLTLSLAAEPMAYSRRLGKIMGPNLGGCRGMGTEVGAVLCLGDESSADCIVETA